MDDSSKANGKRNGATTGVSNGDLDHDDSEDEKDDEAGAGETGAPGGSVFPHNSDPVLVFTKGLQLPKRRRRESPKRRKVPRAVLKCRAPHLESSCPLYSLMASIRKAR